MNTFSLWLIPATDLIKTGMSNKRHKALFLVCQKNKAIINAHNFAKKIFKHKESSYLPHLSLIYGILKDKEKQEMMKEIKN